MDTETRIDTIHSLEMAHQASIHQSDIVTKTEQSRRLRTRVLVLRDDKTLLGDQLSQKETLIKSLLEERDRLRLELENYQSKSRNQQRSQAREVTALRAELQSMNTVSQDSTKLLTEKLALARELNVLKPEIEHLRSQLERQQALISEKLALQRQLDALEVELEAEKRGRQRAATREGSKDAEEELRQKLKDAEKKLAADRKERDQARKEAERAMSEANGKIELLEQRLDMTKTKLRDTQDELRRCRAELEQTRTTSSFSETTEITVPIKNPIQRKRRAMEISTEDITIQTPGAVDPKPNKPAKKRVLNQAVLGEKSNFSITPFLNRTVNLGEELNGTPRSPTAAVAVDNQAPEEDEEVPQPKAVGKVTKKIALKGKDTAASNAAKPRGRPKKVLVDASASKKNIPVSPLKVAKPIKDATSTLPEVVENVGVGDSPEEEQENQPPASEAVKTAKLVKASKRVEMATVAKLAVMQPRRDSAGSSGADAEPKKRKRKLLGGAPKTAFDEDDGEPPAKRPAKVQLGPTRALGKAFGKSTFSPLKKERRGVNASFLA